LAATFLIAEAGVNHNGDRALAHRLVDAAADAGADAVKFQAFQAALVAAKQAPKAEYQRVTTGTGESQFDMLRRLELDGEMHRELAEHCRIRGIVFLSSAFDIASADMVAALGVPLMKVPSGEITNLPLLRHIATLRLPVILSTGMATMAEIEAALAVLDGPSGARGQVTLLHCNSEYPTPWQDVNLRALETMRRSFGVPVGYSDHTLGIEVAVAAVALGATVIEKHFTLDNALPGPDHRASVDPSKLKDLVAAIRHVETALGSPRKIPSPSELKNRSVVRRSLVALRPIRAGEAFASDNVAAKRPEGGLSPMRWDDVMGRIAPRDFAEDEPIEL